MVLILKRNKNKNSAGYWFTLFFRFICVQQTEPRVLICRTLHEEAQQLFLGLCLLLPTTHARTRSAVHSRTTLAEQKRGREREGRTEYIYINDTFI